MFLSKKQKRIFSIAISVTGIIAAIILVLYVRSTERKLKANEVYDKLEQKMFSEAFELATQLEKENNPYVLPMIGFMYRYGIGVPLDYISAREYYEKSITDMDDDYLVYDLAAMVFLGRGGEANPEKGVQYFKRAASMGNSEAAYWLGRVYSGAFDCEVSPDQDEAKKWMEMAAELGHKEAMLELAWFYVACIGCERDLDKAAYWGEQHNAAKVDIIRDPNKVHDYFSIVDDFAKDKEQSQIELELLLDN